MTKISLALATALIVGSACLSAAQAGCGGGYGGFGGGYGGGYSSRSYSSSPSNLYARRQAVAQARAKAQARAQAQAAAKARLLAAKRDAASERINLAKADASTTEAAPVIVVPATPATVTTAALTPEPNAGKALVSEAAKPIEIKKVENTPSLSTKQICRKFSAATGGLIETACE